MNLDRLRAETRAEHEATENVMPLMQDELTREQYSEVLRRLYRVVAGWELWAQTNAPKDLAEVLKARHRAGLIEQDLRSLGHPAIDQPPEFAAVSIPGLDRDDPLFRTSFLGAMYVMEGSTLGGQYIARHVEERLGLASGEGNAYFRGYGDRTGEMWRAFKATLAEIPEEDTSATIAAANAMFRVFRLNMVDARKEQAS